MKKTIDALIAETDRQKEQSENPGRFIGEVHKYFNLQELTLTILHNTVKRIYVHAPEKINGKRTR